LAYADLQIIYENGQNNAEKVEIFHKNGFFRINSYKNTVKIINFKDRSVFFLDNKDRIYCEVELDVDDIKRLSMEETKVDRLFSPKFQITSYSKIIAKVKTALYTYSSEIDAKSKIWATGKYSTDLIEEIMNSLRLVHENGNEVLKSVPYYYTLKNGLLPLQIESKDFNWKAEKVSEEELAEDVFMIPKDFKKVKFEKYFDDIVNSVLDHLEKEVNKD
jgi:hypothetical protein